MMKMFFSAGVLFSFLAIAKVPFPGSAQDAFLLETVESAGKLEYAVAESKETIEFGQDNSFFAVGLLFENKNLPKSLAKSMGQNSILQISFGNRTPQASQIAQFGSLSIKSRDFGPKKGGEVAFQNFDKREKEQAQSAFLIFNSSQMNLSLSDQEKLKGTFFSESGKIKLNPKGESKKVALKVDSQDLLFKKQIWSLTLEAKLGTPFADEKGDIRGTIEIPIYRPSETKSDLWIQKLAQNSLEVFPAGASPNSAPRDLASPKKLKTKTSN